VSYYRDDGSSVAFWCPADVYIEEPMSLVQAYVAACRLHGVEILEAEAVLGVAMSGGQVTAVETARRSIATGAAVDAAGAWTRQVAELAGGQVSVAPVRHQLLVTEPALDVNPADPIVRVVDAAVYLRPAAGGLMFGGFEPEPLPVDPRAELPSFRTDDVPLDPGVLSAMAGQVRREAPLASAGPVAELRGGLFTMSPDGRFVVGPVPGVSGLWAASGCNGSGFSSSLAIGEALAGWIIGGRPPPGLAALSPGRFAGLTDDALIRSGIWQYAHYYDPAAAAGPA
jgi:glycine/D-amino acid oxidase-like deaminating enzyme